MVQSRKGRKEKERREHGEKMLKKLKTSSVGECLRISVEHGLEGLVPNIQVLGCRSCSFLAC